MAGEAVEIHGYVFTPTADGTLRVEDVRACLDAAAERFDELERENAELRARLDQIDALKRLADSTVVRAGELAKEIEAEARQRADALLQEANDEIAARRQRFEASQEAEVNTLRLRANQLQAALDGAMRTLGEALAAMGAGGAADALAAAGASAGTGIVAPAPEDLPDADRAVSPTEAPAAPGVAAWSSERSAEVVDLPPAASAAGLIGTDAPAAGRKEVDTDDSAGAYTSHVPAESPAARVEEPATSPEEAAFAAAWGTAAVEAARPGEDTQETPREAADFLRAEAPVATSTPTSEPSSYATPTPLLSAGTSAETIEIDMRPVRSFADLARVTKLLGQLAPGAQPVDLNLPQHRALFAVQGRDRELLAAQLRDGLPEANVSERDGGIDVLLEQ